jgi:Raf kinase inhibitor-like YbhB/YbcL family protein
MQLTSTAVTPGQPIPTKYTADGPDHSPPLAWDEVPAGVQSFALVADDPDAPRGTWVHWVLYNLPADTDSLAEAVPPTKTLANGAAQGSNDFGRLGYGGPAPPRGKPHRYFFKLYALDAVPQLAPGATKAQLEAAMRGHIVAQAELMATYQR